MASAWTGHGPVTVPPRGLAYGIGAALMLLAFVGAGMGIRAAWKDTGAPELGGAAATSADSADTLTAKPIVELPAAANVAANTADNSSDAADDSGAGDLQAKTAEAQQVQSTASKQGADIDKILASPSEKPPGASKPTTDEAPPPPGPPVKSDVPF